MIKILLWNISYEPYYMSHVWQFLCNWSWNSIIDTECIKFDTSSGKMWSKFNLVTSEHTISNRNMYAPNKIYFLGHISWQENDREAGVEDWSGWEIFSVQLKPRVEAAANNENWGRPGLVLSLLITDINNFTYWALIVLRCKWCDSGGWGCLLKS